eukprot:1652585-Rhodomonas_salina.2
MVVKEVAIPPRKVSESARSPMRCNTNISSNKQDFARNSLRANKYRHSTDGDSPDRDSDTDTVTVTLIPLVHAYPPGTRCSRTPGRNPRKFTLYTQWQAVIAADCSLLITNTTNAMVYLEGKNSCHWFFAVGVGGHYYYKYWSLPPNRSFILSNSLNTVTRRRTGGKIPLRHVGWSALNQL